MAKTCPTSKDEEIIERLDIERWENDGGRSLNWR